MPLSPLKEDDLRPLFTGPDRVFHLREDAARELHRRTAGLPARIVAELRAWERAGHATRTRDEWSVSRTALDRLAAGRTALPEPPPLPPQPSPDLRASQKLPLPLEDLAAWIDFAFPYTHVEELSRITSEPAPRIQAAAEDLISRGAVTRTAGGSLLATGSRGIAARRRAEWRRRAHSAVARALSPGAHGRLFHLLASQSDRDPGEPDDIVTETLTLVTPMLATGHLGQATELLSDGLLAARRAARGRDRPFSEARLLGLWVDLALSDGSPRALDRALYEVCRATPRTSETASLEALLRASLAMRTATGERALSLVEQGAHPFSDPDLELRRHHVRVQAARLCSLEREEAILASVARWAEQPRGPRARASLSDWLGRLRYGQGRFDEAAALHAEAAEGLPWITERIGALLNGASALLEAFRFDEAAESAESARDLAIQCRHAYYEVRAEWLLRSARYRRGDSLSPDEELVQLAARVAVANLEALVCLNESAVALRCGAFPVALSLAERTRDLWTSAGKTWGILFAQALVMAVSGAPLEEAKALAKRAEECPVPGAGIQMLGLSVRACPELVPLVAPIVRRLAETIPHRHWPLRMDVLSVHDALVLAGDPPSGPPPASL
ncbi:MAG: hypothetical protein R3B70_28965 [Polyangiaceae bacterium]